MQEKTFKGKLKKVRFYALCYSPIALAVGFFGLMIGGACVSSSYDGKKDKIHNEIYPKILMTEEFKEYKSDKEEKLISALQDGIISTDEFAKKIKNLQMYIMF